MNSAEIAELQAELLELETIYAELKAAYRACFKDGVSNYSLNTGVGSQSVQRHSPKVLKSEMEDIKTEIDRIKAMLNGRSVITMRMDRSGGGFRIG